MITTTDNDKANQGAQEPLTALAESFRRDKAIINRFVEVVERRAEAKMLMTGKLAGANYTAMKELQKAINESCGNVSGTK